MGRNVLAKELGEYVQGQRSSLLALTPAKQVSPF